VNIDNSPITVTTINVHDDNQSTHTYDLSNQFPAWDATAGGGSLGGDALIAAQTPLQTFSLPSPARINTLIIVLDGLTLSPELTPNPTTPQGDYRVVNSTTVEFVWELVDCPRMHNLTDTPILLARYTLA
jgi:hypothetical protein